MNARGALGIVLAVVLGAVGFAGWRHLEGIREEREQQVRAELVRRFDAYREHARFLARQDASNLAGFLTDFRGLARVVLFDARGAPVLQAERFDYLVAELPAAQRTGRLERIPAPGTIEVSGLETDRTRRDLRPDLRQVVHYTARRADGGALRLTVYAAPFLGGATLVTDAGAPLLDSGRGVLEDGWHPSVPIAADLSATAPYIALAFGVLVLGAAALLLSMRQSRARDRARMERQLAQGERLQSLGLLASGIAHEINNPLEGIANWLAVGDMDRAREGLDRIARLTGELLRFARGDPDAPPTGSSDVRESFARAYDLARVSRVWKGVEIDDQLPRGLSARVPGAVLEQVFLNLLLNAAAATQGQAERRIRVAPSDAAVIVEDNGPGMKTEDLGRIFDPFFSRSGGSGLGLSVSYGLLTAAGGNLRAANREEGGARFTVELPSS